MIYIEFNFSLSISLSLYFTFYLAFHVYILLCSMLKGKNEREINIQRENISAK